MKKLIAAAILLVVFMVVFLIVQADRHDREVNPSASKDLKTYSNENLSDEAGQSNVGGSGTDTKPSPSGTGPGPEGDLLSQ